MNARFPLGRTARRFLYAATALAAVQTSQFVMAQESVSADATRAKEIADQIALEKARADLVAQRLSVLGLQSGATGKTELKEKGGEFEGWLLSANAIDASADKIAAALRSPDLAGTRIVVLAADEVFDAALPVAMAKRIDALQRRATTAAAATGCAISQAGEGVGPGGPQALPIAGALPYIGALIGALKTDTTITGIEGPKDARLLVNALAERTAQGDRWIVPSDISKIEVASELGKAWDALAETRAALSACRAKPAGKGKAAVAKAAAQKAVLDPIIAEIDAFETKEVLGGDGVSPLVRALRFEQLANDVDLSVMRVYVEKAGGSILQKSNLFTMLGARAIGITGGAVVGWRIVDAATGQLRGGGNLACRTALTNMRAIHRGAVRASSCEWTTAGTSAAANAGAGQ